MQGATMVVPGALWSTLATPAVTLVQESPGPYILIQASIRLAFSR